MKVYLIQHKADKSFVGAGLKVSSKPKIWNCIGHVKNAIRYQFFQDDVETVKRQNKWLSEHTIYEFDLSLANGKEVQL